MAPASLAAFAVELVASNITSRNNPNVGAYEQKSWPGTINVASVDLMAMVVSDAGLASTEPEWWNSSPFGCMLIALQPRGGWQVMQRTVQWGNDGWARSFGVSCKMPALYCYFACSMRNRLEVWESEDFISPMEGTTGMAALPENVDPVPTKAPSSKEEVDNATATLQPLLITPIEISAVGETKKTPLVELKVLEIDEKKDKDPFQKKVAGDSGWKQFELAHGTFTIGRPTKLVDGSRGGQAFVCNILCPREGNAYSVEEQARMQFLSIVLVTVSLIKSDTYEEVLRVLQDDFDLTHRLGGVFKRLIIILFFAEFAVIALVISIIYALWSNNIYGQGAPYVIQICSLISWAFGAAGLLMLGGNPRVRIDETKSVPEHIKERLDAIPGDFVEINFGSLHGSIFTQDRGSCTIDKGILAAVCKWNLCFTRNIYWKAGLAWFALHILTSVALQVGGSRVATVGSQVMGIAFLISTSIVRGQGVSGPEEWMIPRWKMRQNAGYAVNLQGHILSRVK